MPKNASASRAVGATMTANPTVRKLTCIGSAYGMDDTLVIEYLCMGGI